MEGRLTAIRLLPALLVAHDRLPPVLLGAADRVDQVHRLPVMVVRGLYRNARVLHGLCHGFALLDVYDVAVSHREYARGASRFPAQ